MAVDTFKGDAGPENALRQAMNRAGNVANNVMRAATRAQPPQGDNLEMTEMDVVSPDRRTIRRVDIKVSLVSYIDSVFRARTPQDGTIVGVSREQLLQELTELFVELDERASQPAAPSPAKVKAAHSYGEPVPS